MTAADARTWLRRLEAERLDAIDARLGENAVYMAELQYDLAASRVAYVGLAITEIATLRAQLAGPRSADRQFVGAGGLRTVPVIPAAEIAAQPVIDDRAQLLHSVKHLPGRVAALATQRDARPVPRPRGLRR